MSLNLTSLFQCRLYWLFSLYIFTVVPGSLHRYPGGLYRPSHRINSPSLSDISSKPHCPLAVFTRLCASIRHKCLLREISSPSLQGLTCPQCLPGLGKSGQCRRAEVDVRRLDCGLIKGTHSGASKCDMAPHRPPYTPQLQSPHPLADLQLVSLSP